LKFLIVNADDFGYGRGINRGILEAHRQGVVTSATLVVNAPFTAEAVAIARDNPGLSVGLHVNFTNEADRLCEFDDPAVCRVELRRQFDRFLELLGRLPTHLDSHQHVHRRRTTNATFLELATEHGLPLRDHSPVVFKGGFYGQWEYGVGEPDKVSLEQLERILRRELVAPGIWELACHPGYFDPEFEAVYHREREWELRTLTDPRLRAVLAEEGIRLIGFRDLPEALAELRAGSAA
jgi:predicted glycoside hydrolase/deacetylase ChbG (UPF0249 family)